MSVTPYLNVADAAAAIRFYTDAFGAVETFRLPSDDGKKIMHAVMAIAGGTIFLSDVAPPREPAAVAIALGLDGAPAVDALADRVAAAGAAVTFGPQDMFWGDRFAEITDPFGHRWMLTAPLG
jgi:uncharacterized glyoxalase superfamily protein PhnB